MKKKKLLIVDDSATILKAAQSLMNDTYPFEPYYASSFAEAKQLIGNEKFFAAILDLELPDARSGEVVDFAVAHEIHPIVLTGTFNPELRKTILKKPIVDYIIKNSLEDIKNALEVAKNLMFFDNKVALIVDDSKLARMQLRQMFEVLSFYVIEASSGVEALDKVANSPQIDIITIDYEMPGMDGMDLIQKIRKMANIIQPVIFAVSSDESEINKVKFIKNGANDYFIKPAHKEEFNHKLGNYFRIISQHEELVTSQKIIEEYNRALNIGSYVTKADPSGIITFVSDKMTELTGYGKEELIGQSHSIFRHPNTPKSIFQELWKTVQNKEIWSGILKNCKKGGAVFYARTTIIPILNINQEIVEYVALRDDVSELIASQQKLQVHFQTDLLTSLSNRLKLLDDLEVAVLPTVALLNLVGFKEINAEYGYRIGDEVLVQIARILSQYAIKYPIQLYRLNADEFALMSTEMEAGVFTSMCCEIIDKIKEAPIRIHTFVVEVKAKVGIAVGNSEVLLHADIALKESKTLNQSVVVYDDTIKASLEYKNNLLWKSKIVHGIKNDLFIPYFQPIMDNQTGNIHKYEALIRLKDENGNIITPFHFLDVAKKTRHYFELTMMMIRKTFEMFKENDLHFSLNFSVEDIENEDVILYFRNLLYEYSGIQKRLTIELVESEGIENFEEVNLFIKQMKSIGCKIAIDDFGTGYSNFEYLMQLDVDYIKIDGSLIRKIAESENNYSVVETIVGFARKNRIKTIAEFVSSEEIYTHVKALGIDYSQGYYFAEPTEHLMHLGS